MLDLLLINPPHPWQVNPHAQAPVGMLYLAAVARRAGLEVGVLNLAGAGMDPSGWDIPWAKVYGLTGTYLDVEAINALAAKLKTRQVEARVLAGGPVALSARELSVDVDTVVHGEAENAIARLVREESPREVRCDGVDVNALPDPARDLWAGPFGGDIFAGHKNYFGGGSTTILSSRGCPFSCAFCASKALTSRKVRFREPAAVVAEMERVATDYGVRQFRFSDEFLTCKREHVGEICKAIRASKVLRGSDGCAWRASVGANPHDLDLFRMMKRSGCRELSFGVESADPKVLNLLTNKCTTDDCRVALHNAKSVGLVVRALMMTGLPGESWETIEYMRCFCRTADFDTLAVTIFAPVPGCAIYERPEDFGCRLIPERAGKGFYLFGPDGRNPAEPTVEIAGLKGNDHALIMAEIVGLAERTQRIGKG